MNSSSPYTIEHPSCGNPITGAAFDKDSTSVLALPDKPGTFISHYASTLHSALSPIENRDYSIIEELTQTICLLQDVFIEKLYAQLATSNLTPDVKITLKLSGDNTLRMAEETAMTEAIDEALAKAPELTELFIEISLQSSALRDLRSLFHLCGLRQDELSLFPSHATAYQVTLKGEMNHFFFL